MKDWFCRTFTPWRAAALFEDGDAWFAYLVRYDKVCNAIRVVLFAVAALMLIAGYAMTDDVAYAHPVVYNCAGGAGPAFLISLLIAQNEKQLPKDLQQK